MERPVLETNSLSKAFGGVTAVDNVTCSFQADKISSIIGPNGAGKTTLFNLISGFLRPNSGDITIQGEKASGLPPYRIARLGVSRSFQLVRVFPQLTVLDNIMLGYQGLKGEKLLNAVIQARSARTEYSKCKERAREILKYVDLGEYETGLANDLSYGQQKLLEIGRALASDPRVLLLDEPMAGLSMTMIARMKALIQGLRAEGRAVIIIEHNMEVVVDMSDAVMVMDMGKMIAFGSPEAVLKMPAVVDAYLGVRARP